jgi:hypothetical protein
MVYLWYRTFPLRAIGINVIHMKTNFGVQLDSSFMAALRIGDNLWYSVLIKFPILTI